MPAPAQAVDQQVIWKNAEIQAFALALVAHALTALDAGHQKFTTDIVPDTERGDGPGIAGSVITLLQNASLIQPVGVVQAGTFYAERVKSDRMESKGRYVNVYRLCSRSLALTFLSRNKKPAPMAEPEPFHGEQQILINN